MRLELDAHPTVALVVALVTARRHRVGKREKCRAIPALRLEPVQVELEFQVQHRLEPAPRHVTVRGTVNRVAHRHVVGRHALGDRPRRAAHPEKPAHDLLPRADFREGAIPARVEIDPESLLMGIDDFVFHGFENLAESGRTTLIYPSVHGTSK